MIDYGKVLPKKIVDIPKSGIRKYFDMITPDMKDVISLTVGQPDFVTPWHIREAGIQSLETGKTFYTANAGLEELRREIDLYMTRRFGLSYNHKDKINTKKCCQACRAIMKLCAHLWSEALTKQEIIY